MRRIAKRTRGISHLCMQSMVLVVGVMTRCIIPCRKPGIDHQAAAGRPARRQGFTKVGLTDKV